jgi:hypothetical protein
MYKGTNEITNKGLGFKLTNSMSFGESMITTGFNQKTIKANLHVRVNYTIPPWNQRGKVPEEGGKTLLCGADQPLGPPISLLFASRFPTVS